MNRVWIVDRFAGFDSMPEVVAVFDSNEKAEDFVAAKDKPNDYDITQWDVE